jgi:hypothetical protein
MLSFKLPLCVEKAFLAQERTKLSILLVKVLQLVGVSGADYEIVDFGVADGAAHTDFSDHPLPVLGLAFDDH